MNDLVSIVVPVYNMGDSVEVCVKSLLVQDYENIEIILVDDGSKDNSLSVCKKLQEYDSRIKVFNTENRGSGPARNTGIENATGRYIYFPDADDKLNKNAIGKMVDAMESGTFDLVVFGYISLDAHDNVVLKKKYTEFSNSGINIRRHYANYMGASSEFGIQGAPWNKLFDLELIKNNKIEYPPLRRHQDEGFISRYMCCARNVHFIPDVLYSHYVNDLKLEWKKYPTDYIDAVIGLNDTRKETILRWNRNDTATHKLVEREYICNVIKAFELSFSPKMCLDSKARKEWLLEKIKYTKINKINVPNNLGKYQVIVLKLIKGGHINLVYHILHFKIKAEQTKIYKILK